MFTGKNRNRLIKVLRLGVWLYIGAVVLAALGLVLFNPGNVFGESEAVIAGVFPTYPGQSAALQILGTFIAAVGAVAHLLDIRFRGNGSVPLGVAIAAVIGPMLIISGQIIQGMKDNPLVLVVLGVMSVSVILIWILAAVALAVIKWVYPWLKRVYSWLKSRLKSGG